VAGIVRDASDSERSIADLVEADDRFGADASRAFAPGEAVRRRTTPGGAGPGPVAAQMEAARTCLAEQAAWLHV
jgi:argininosuccinate lyase